MTKEYIEREAAIKEAIAERDLHSPFTPELSGWRVGAEKVANRLASIPAADVVEVRHGRWIPTHYVVLKSDTGECVENCFVLRPDKDPAAKAALMAYAAATKNEKLSEDIMSWLSSMDGGQDDV